MEIAREEERAKEELKVLEENFRIKQELVQKEAQMIASIKHEEDNHIVLDEFPMRPPVEMGSRELLEKFLDDQSASVLDVHVPTPNQLPVPSTPWLPVGEPKERIIASQATNLDPLNPFSLAASSPLRTLFQKLYEPRPLHPELMGRNPSTTPLRQLTEVPKAKFNQSYSKLRSCWRKPRTKAVFPSRNQEYSMETCCNIPSG